MFTDPSFVAFALAIAYAVCGVRTFRLRRDSQIRVEQRQWYSLMTIFLAANAAGSTYMWLTMDDWQTLYPTDGTTPMMISGAVMVFSLPLIIAGWMKLSRVFSMFALAGGLAAGYVNCITEYRTNLAPMPSEKACERVSDYACNQWHLFNASMSMETASWSYWGAVVVMIVAVLALAVKHLRKTDTEIGKILDDVLSS